MKRTPLERRTPLARGTRMARETPIRKKNPKKGHKFPRLVDEGLREFVRGLACCVCGARAPSHPHHVRTRGAGGADRDNIVPLSADCHDELHRTGRRTFAAKHGVDLPAIALRVTAAFDLLRVPSRAGAPDRQEAHENR